MNHKRMTICVDFDGVIHSYENGWQNGELYGHVVPGFWRWLAAIGDEFRIAVYSSRSKDPDGKALMQDWLESKRPDWCQTPLEYAASKPPAWLTIDDRCIKFEGDWSAPVLQIEALRAFRSWVNQ